jgi:predicted alpha/beta hydrolase
MQEVPMVAARSHLTAVPEAAPEPPAPPPFEAIELPAVDGAPLAARAYPPTALPARGAVLIVGAMGVPQGFYQPLAVWLAARGHHVLTFDFRGMGESRTGPMRAVDVDVVAWGRLDATAALRALQDRAPGLPLTWIGHSLGGQILPFVPDHIELAKVITVAAGSGYWRENSPPLRRKVWLFWFVATPLATPLFGYFPGKALGMVGDLPRGVIRQWRRWCLDPEYAVGAEGPAVRDLFARVTAPITAISFTDDEMMSARNTESLHGFYTRAAVTHRRFEPAELGKDRVGHFGFFRAAMADVWDRVLAPELP